MRRLRRADLAAGVSRGLDARAGAALLRGSAGPSSTHAASTRSNACSPASARTSSPSLSDSAAEPCGCALCGSEGVQLLAQIAEVRLRVDRAADHALDRLCGRELAPERVQVLAEPVVQLARTPRARSALRRPGAPRAPSPRSAPRERFPAGTWGSSRRAARPVRVLQDADRVVRHLEAHELRRSACSRLRGGPSTASRPERSSCSSSKRRMTCSP